jgi:hypothetical protein
VTQDIHFGGWQLALHDEDPELVFAPSVQETIKAHGMRMGQFLKLKDGGPVVLNMFIAETVGRGDLEIGSR